MNVDFTEYIMSECCEVTDYVANGSFASLKENVLYRNEPSYALLVRTTDHVNNWNGQFVWVDQSAYEFLSKSEILPGDLVASSVGSVGIVFRAPNLGVPMTLGPNAVRIRPLRNSYVTKDFLYYYFLSPIGQELIASISSGSSVQPKFNKTQLRSAPLTLPNIEYQIDVVSVLNSIDEKILHNRTMAANLEAIARRLFKSWFVDFDPVSAKAVGEKPAGLADDIVALFPDRFVESEIGEVPEGWNIGRISDFSKNVRVGCPPSQFSAEDFYVGLEHFDRRCLTLWNGGSGEDATSNKSRFARGDLLFGKLRPYFHKVAVAPMDGICSTDILVIRCVDKAYREFMYFTLFQDNVIQYVSDASGGTRMPRTNWETLADYDCVFPPKALASVFGEIVAPMIETMIQCAAENSTLTELRDLLLPRLISGKLRVKDAETIIQEAVA